MRKRFFKTLAVFGITALISTQLFIGQADASWGAAKLAEIQKQQPTAPSPTIPSPAIPSPTTPPPATIPPPVVTPPATGTGTTQESLSSQESLLFDLVNNARVAKGLKPLVLMPELNSLARMKSRDMVDKNYFSHVSPTYGSFTSMVYQAGIKFRSVGETLALSSNAQKAFYQFMGSPAHQDILLSRNMTHVGVGVVPYKYGVAVTLLFIMQ